VSSLVIGRALAHGIGMLCDTGGISGAIYYLAGARSLYSLF